MSVTQSQFRDAILDPKRAVPDGLSDPEGRGAGRRFSVYRNNVVMGLTEALGVSFPVIAKLLGPTNFQNIAGVYVRAHPPKSPMMMYYGDDFAEFLESFPPLKHLGYLGDVARLEHARRCAYHAADIPPIDPQKLAAMPPEDLAQSRLRFAPALHLIPSPWPILDIWNFNSQEDAPQPGAEAQNLLITRPELDPVMTLLTQAELRFLQALQLGQTLAQAHDAAAGPDPDFEPTECLSKLFAGRAVTNIK